MSQAEKNAIPVHYWLASAEVYHCHKGQQEQGVIPATVNVVFTTPENKILGKDMTKAQRGAQHQLIQRAGTIEIDVVDVVFNSFNYLGFMSPNEFLGITDEDLKEGMAKGAAAANGTVQ